MALLVASTSLRPVSLSLKPKADYHFKDKTREHVKPPNMESDTRLITSEIQILRSESLPSSMEPVPGLYPGASTYHRAREDSRLPPDICARVVGEDFAHKAANHIDGVLQGNSVKAPLREGCW